MTSIPFQLIPFGSDGPGGDPIGSSLTNNLSITGHLSITADSIEVAYQLQGDLDQLSLPSPASQPERRDLLWQTTCLELFLARRGANGYWEFNLSPAGHWNVYRLEGYRQGLTPEPAYLQLPFQVNQHRRAFTTQQLALTLRCPLPPDLRQSLEVGITAVIQGNDGTLSYWALHHPAAEADFHHRGGFTIQVS
jgi:hypothetical protein